LDNRQNKITEFNLRQSIAVALVFLIFMQALFALPDLLRPAFSLGYERAALTLVTGFAIGMVLGGGLTRLLRNRIGESLVIQIKSWHLNAIFGILCLLWIVIPAILSRTCMSLWEESIKSRAIPSAVSECFANTHALQRFGDGAVLGILIGIYLWAFKKERQYKGQLIIAMHSKPRWSIQGWPVTDTALAIGFALFLIYIFYRIFTLK